MSIGGELTQPGRAWTALAATLAAGTLLGWWLPSPVLDWQPGLWAGQPWRLVSAAFVHWSALHLGGNVAGAAVVAVLGRVARLPTAAALAWLAAWPLTHLGLLLQPALAHYGGMSGVLHAGVAVAGLWIVRTGRGRARAIGLAVLLGLAVKIVLERPWAGPLARPQGWDIALAPLAHASGALAGLLCAAVALALVRTRAGTMPPTMRPPLPPAAPR